MKKVARNEPCPCGSGKKYKNCHMKEEAKKEVSNKTMMYLAIFILFIIVGAIGYYYNTKPKPQNEPPPKVWSEEHQHYH